MLAKKVIYLCNSGGKWYLVFQRNKTKQSDKQNRQNELVRHVKSLSKSQHLRMSKISKICNKLQNKRWNLINLDIPGIMFIFIHTSSTFLQIKNKNKQVIIEITHDSQTILESIVNQSAKRYMHTFECLWFECMLIWFRFP